MFCLGKMWIPESRDRIGPIKITWIKREGRENFQNKSWICYYNKEYCASKSNTFHCTACHLSKSQHLKTLQRKRLFQKIVFLVNLCFLNKFINLVSMISWIYILWLYKTRVTFFISFLSWTLQNPSNWFSGRLFNTLAIHRGWWL